MPCPNCRKELPDGAAECGHCGVIVAKFLARAERTAEPAAAAPPAPATRTRDWTMPAIGGSLLLLLAALARCGRSAVARNPSYGRPFYEVPLAHLTHFVIIHGPWFVLLAAAGLFVIPLVDRFFKDDPGIAKACALTRRIARWPGILATSASLAFWLSTWGPDTNDQLFLFWFPGMIIMSFLFGLFVWGLARLAILPCALLLRRR